MKWLFLGLDMLSLLTSAFSLILLISIRKGIIDPAFAGLAVTYGLNLNLIQAVVIWNLCYLENKIISVEGILQYCAIPSEPPLLIEESRPDHSWPSHGEVHICDLQVRYAPHMPLVLRVSHMHFPRRDENSHSRENWIRPCLKGLYEETCTLLMNTQMTIWEALDKCQLGNEVRKKEGKLDSRVTENEEENWRMGQRQLVCPGLVLLEKSKVLVLDEATASVDTATGNLIQLTLRQHFTDCTVITIARLIELLENKSSSFAQLVAEYSLRANSSFQNLAGK